MIQDSPGRVKMDLKRRRVGPTVSGPSLGVVTSGPDLSRRVDGMETGEVQVSFRPLGSLGGFYVSISGGSGRIGATTG